MARPLRIEFPGAFYHLTERGDRREAIYEDDVDRIAFLDLVAEVVERLRWRCHAYCLMTNPSVLAGAPQIRPIRSQIIKQIRKTEYLDTGMAFSV